MNNDTEKRTEMHACDCISKAAAIEALESIGSLDTEADRQYARTVFENLPSVQPESCEDAVSRQRLLSDLKELVAAWKKYPVMAEQIKGVEAAIGYVEAIPSAESNCSEIPNNSDCISRQAAITAIQKAYADTEGGTDKCAVWKNVGLTNALHIMQDLPSARSASYRQVTGKLDCISRQAAIDVRRNK